MTIPSLVAPAQYRGTASDFSYMFVVWKTVCGDQAMLSPAHLLEVGGAPVEHGQSIWLGRRYGCGRMLLQGQRDGGCA